MSEAVLYEILLDLQKAYNYLDRERYMDILVGYGVVPQSIWILQTYWVRITILAKAGGYHAPPPPSRGSVE